VLETCIVWQHSVSSHAWQHWMVVTVGRIDCIQRQPRLRMIKDVNVRSAPMRISLAPCAGISANSKRLKPLREAAFYIQKQVGDSVL
jgi:hypothetical protein